MHPVLFVFLLSLWTCFTLYLYQRLYVRALLKRYRTARSPGLEPAHTLRRTPSTKNVRRPTSLVFCDVDDTIKPGGGKTWGSLAGTDKSYTQIERHAIYPGMARFLFELSKLGVGGHPDSKRVPQINFLTGRPIGSLQNLQDKLIAESGEPDWGKRFKLDEDRHYITMNGAIRDTGRHLPWHTDKMFLDYGETKYKNLKQFCEESRETFKLFVLGDDGQGDLVLASRLLEDTELRDRIQGIFIHKVVDKPTAKDRPPQLNRVSKPDPRVIYYSNVVDLLQKIDASPVEATFSKEARENIERQFLSDFAEKQKSPRVDAQSAQYQSDVSTFNLLTPQNKARKEQVVMDGRKLDVPPFSI